MDPIAYWTLHLGWILVAWLFALGGVVGSFLNVVVYRLPAGKSIVHPGSACPVCGHPIRWFDNLPIVSWLLLGGRCRDCRAKISPRYPLVEFATAVLFAGLFLVDARPRIVGMADAIPAAVPWGWWVLLRYSADLWLLSTLLCAALIEFDGARIPRGVFQVAVFIGFVAAAGVYVWEARVHEVFNAAIGLVAGAAIGGLFDFIQIDRLGAPREPTRAWPANSAAFPLLCVGTFLGWIAALAIGSAAAIEIAIVRQLMEDRTARSRFGWSFAALVGALVWIIAARWIPVSLPLTPDP